MSKTGYKTFTEQDFNKMCTMVELGMTTGQIRFTTGRSQSSVARVRKAKTWNEYQQAIRKHNDKYNTVKSKNDAPALPLDPETERRFDEVLAAIEQLQRRIDEIFKPTSNKWPW